MNPHIPNDPYQPVQGLDPERLYEMAQAQTPKRSPARPAPGIAAIQPHFPELEIHALVGQGGMGAVYRAHHPGLGRDVALKVLYRELGEDPGFAERFAREARVLARLDHPNVVPVYDHGQRDGWCFLTMALVDGMSLREMMRLGRMAPEEALDIVPQLCAALSYAHGHGIVHRDIKPENILIDSRGQVRIVDFGLAKLLGDGPGQVTLTGTDQVMGTPQYMAPEQLLSPLAVDHRADIYSLGVVFYEMLTGALPMGRFRPPSASSGVGPGVDDVVLRSLAQAPEDRYQAAREVETDLAAARKGRTPKRATVAGTRLHPAIKTSLVLFAVSMTLPVFFFLFYFSLSYDVAMEGEPAGGPEDAVHIGLPLMWVMLALMPVLPIVGSLYASRGVRGIRREPELWHGVTLGVALTWLPVFVLVAVLTAATFAILGSSIAPDSALAPVLALFSIVVCIIVAAWVVLRESRRIEATLAR